MIVMGDGSSQYRAQSIYATISKNSINLEGVLKDRTLCDLFHKWTLENLCSENFAFFFEVEKFKNLSDPSLVEAEAKNICEMFIREKSVSQVNIDFDTREGVEKKLANPTKDMFDSAQQTVYDSMRYDSLTKFVDSDIYREWKGLPKAKLAVPKKARTGDVPLFNPDSIKTLWRCLDDPVALEEFRNFTKLEFSDAALQFYLEVRKYKEDPNVLHATQIYSQYLSSDSDCEVDTNPKAKKLILEKIHLGQVDKDLFNRLQTQVFAVMAQDSFFRFQLHMLSRFSLI